MGLLQELKDAFHAEIVAYARCGVKGNEAYYARCSDKIRVNETSATHIPISAKKRRYLSAK